MPETSRDNPGVVTEGTPIDLRSTADRASPTWPAGHTRSCPVHRSIAPSPARPPPRPLRRLHNYGDNAQHFHTDLHRNHALQCSGFRKRGPHVEPSHAGRSAMLTLAVHPVAEIAILDEAHRADDRTPIRRFGAVSPVRGRSAAEHMVSALTRWRPQRNLFVRALLCVTMVAAHTKRNSRTFVPSKRRIHVEINQASLVNATARWSNLDSRSIC